MDHPTTRSMSLQCLPPPTRPVHRHHYFGHYHPRYKCCCGSVHAKPGLLAIGLLSALLWAHSLSELFIVVFVRSRGGEASLLSFYVQLASLGLDLAVIASTLAAWRMESANLLVPFISVEVGWRAVQRETEVHFIYLDSLPHLIPRLPDPTHLLLPLSLPHRQSTPPTHTTHR